MGAAVRKSRPEPPESPWSGPWFSIRPQLAFAVAVVLYLGVFGLRFVGEDSIDAVGMLYVFPVALVAMTRGRWAGLLAGVVAIALIVVWAAALPVHLSTVGWLSRVLPLLLVGLLIGDARDRLERAARLRAAHALAVERRAEAVAINDSLVQGMSAAKWSIEAGEVASGLRMLEETVELGHRLVSALIREADGHGGPEYAVAPDRAGEDPPPAGPSA